MAPNTSTPEAAEGYEIVARYHVETDANQAVETLVVRGIGAMVERQAQEAPFALVVVAGEAARAREVLGLPEVEDPDAPIAKPARPQVFWVVLIFLAAMVVLPVIAFYVSFKLTGG